MIQGFKLLDSELGGLRSTDISFLFEVEKSLGSE